MMFTMLVSSFTRSEVGAEVVLVLVAIISLVNMVLLPSMTVVRLRTKKASFGGQELVVDRVRFGRSVINII